MWIACRLNRCATASPAPAWRALSHIFDHVIVSHSGIQLPVVLLVRVPLHSIHYTAHHCPGRVAIHRVTLCHQSAAASCVPLPLGPACVKLGITAAFELMDRHAKQEQVRAQRLRSVRDRNDLLQKIVDWISEP